MVLDPDRHVLLEVYAPWCEHCKAFEGSYEMIGQDMQERYGDAIRVVKMDGESNEVEGLDIDSYPTLLFWPAQAGLSSSDGTMADGQTPWTWSYEKDEMLERMRGLLFGLAKDHEFDAAVEKSKVRAQKAEADAAAAAADELLGGGGGATITMDAEDADGWDDHDEL